MKIEEHEHEEEHEHRSQRWIEQIGCIDVKMIKREE